MYFLSKRAVVRLGEGCADEPSKFRPPVEVPACRRRGYFWKPSALFHCIAVVDVHAEFRPYCLWFIATERGFNRL